MKYNYSKIYGKVFECKNLFQNVTIIPFYHPAVATYNPNMKKILEEDFKIAVNLKIMIEELNILKIVKEDILKLLAETKEKVSPKFLKEKIKVSSFFIAKAVEILKNEGLILIEKEIISLTKNGLTEAEKIIKRHLFLENYFKDKKSKEEAHLMAELLEHYITEEVVNNIKKFSTLKKEGVLLSRLGLNEKGLIVDIEFSDYKLFERIVSIGIIPGEPVEVTNKIPSGVVIKINNKKIVLDKKIANEIKVLEYEPH